MKGRRTTIVALGFAVIAAASAPARAQEALTLDQAVAEALRASDIVRAEDERVAAARGAAGAARANLLPQVTFEERLTRTDNPAYGFSMKINQGGFTGADLQGAPGSFNDPVPITDFQSSFTVAQPVFSRRASLGLAMARAEAEAVGLDRERLREEVAHRAVQAWVGARAAAALLDAAARAEEAAAEHLRLAEVAAAAGTGLESDRLRAQVALGEARRQRLAVASDLEIARRGLGLAVGRETQVIPAEGGAPIPPAELDGLLVAAGGRADLRALGARVANAGRAVELARAAALPEVGLLGTVQANDPDLPLGADGTSWMVGVGLTWRLFDGGRTSAERERAEAERRRAGHLLDAMTKEARFRVQEAWLRWKEAEAGLALAREAATAAEEGVRLVRVRYENGLATMVALLDGQGALDRARADAARAEAGTALALAELRFRAGAAR